MYKSRGISLITLIVTIMVMLILIGVVGVYSLDTINEGHEAVTSREFTNVREYVLRQQIRLEAEEFIIDTSKYPDIVLSTELLYLLVDDKLTEQEINSIIEVNSADIEDKYKYYYLNAEGKYFDDNEFSGNNSTVKDVKNDYIINFYTGTVICINEKNFKVEGLIKGLDEIISLI